MATGGDMPRPPRTAIWSEELSRWVPIRKVLKVEYKPLLTISIIGTEPALPTNTPLRFRFEYPVCSRGIIDTFNTGRPAYAYIGREVTARIEATGLNMWGGGLGTDQYEVAQYYARITGELVKWDSDPGSSLIS
jgi:hypothetical protein